MSGHAVHRPLADRWWLHAALVLVAALVVYLPALRNGFAYDDVPIIPLNERVTSFDLPGLATGSYWQDTTSGLYRPLTSVSYAVDWRISGGSPAWFHFVNACWHGAASVLLLLLLRALRIGAAPALLGAAVFAFHPVHVEAVANVVGRAELMAATFVLAAALLFARAQRGLRHPRGLALLALLFLGALLSKEGAVVLPGVLVLVDSARGRLRPGRLRTWLRARVAPAAALGGVLVAYVALRIIVLDTVAPADLDPSLEVLASPLHRGFTALQAWPEYARLLFYPRVLLADYGPQILMPATLPTARVLLGAALLLGALAGGIIAWLQGRRVAAAALLWLPVTIAPVSNLIVPIGVLVAERTLYLPSVALSLGVAAAAGVPIRRPALRPALAVIAGIVLGLLAVRTVIRVPEWRTTNTIFFALLDDRPDAFRAVWHLARTAAGRGEPSAARLYADAVRLWPYRPRLLREAVLHAAGTGQAEWSWQLSEFALERVPGDLVIRRYHAGTLLDRGDTLAARQQIMEGLKWHPQDSLLLKMLQAATPPSAPRASGS